MTALMEDVVSDRLTPSKTNAACNAGGKLMKMVDLQMKYSMAPNAASKFLRLPAKAQE